MKNSSTFPRPSSSTDARTDTVDLPKQQQAARETFSSSTGAFCTPAICGDAERSRCGWRSTGAPPWCAAPRAANTELLRLYHSIGRDILERQDHAGWGGKVIDRLAADLRDAFPDLRGFSVRNLHYMRAVAAAWPKESDFLQSPSAELTWSHVTTLITQLDDQQLRTWYATHAVQQRWSRNVLQHQIMSRLHTRIGSAPSNFAVTLPHLIPTSPKP
ncbi:DUF1016 N-terminal domain-containing protein [Kineococcus sp. GCM10028916]|uniref:DUF1016 N-terminal domain-containing protein n=1 Tax=Kineococcus sp. GCM10028916 TaxID=3273394 RepID=UPI003628E65C